MTTDSEEPADPIQRWCHPCQKYLNLDRFYRRDSTYCSYHANRYQRFLKGRKKIQAMIAARYGTRWAEIKRAHPDWPGYALGKFLKWQEDDAMKNLREKFPDFHDWPILDRKRDYAQPPGQVTRERPLP